MVRCPRCGREASDTGKEWDYSKGTFYVRLFNCTSCKKSFMAYFRGEELSHTIPKAK